MKIRKVTQFPVNPEHDIMYFNVTTRTSKIFKADGTVESHDSWVSKGAPDTLTIEGYYPLYETEALANLNSPLSTSHSHSFTINGVAKIYYMPDGLGALQFHGDYPYGDSNGDGILNFRSQSFLGKNAMANAGFDGSNSFTTPSFNGGGGVSVDLSGSLSNPDQGSFNNTQDTITITAENDGVLILSDGTVTTFTKGDNVTSPPGSTVIMEIATPSTTDSDGDGIPDSTDSAPGNPSVSGVDADGDGVDDAVDSDPSDPNTSGQDTDGDGVDDAVDADPTDSNVSVACASSPVTITVSSEYDSQTSTPTYKYTTSDSNGNGGLFGCIDAVRGQTLTINVVGQQVELESHPLKITDYNDLGQAKAPLPGVQKTQYGAEYTLTWTVPCDETVTKYQYQCENHAGMRGTINVTGTCPDTDGDGVVDLDDVFPNDASESTDTDGDGTGDNADAFPNDASETTDSDGDGVGDNADSDPGDPNTTGVDADGDGVDDAVDSDPSDSSTSGVDADGDGVDDAVDSDPSDSNTSGVDADGDGVDDAVDSDPSDSSTSGQDADGDGVDDAVDTDPNDSNTTGVDADGDGVDDAVDSDPSDSSTSGVDADGDGVDDAVDSDPSDSSTSGQDADGDGVDDAVDTDPNDSNTTGVDADGDGVDDAVDSDPSDSSTSGVDADGDGVDDAVDSDPSDSSTSGQDADGDGVDDAVDSDPSDSSTSGQDADGDGVDDAVDSDPSDSSTSGVDADGDGVDDAVDSDPSDPNTSGVDADGDGVDDAAPQTSSGPNSINFETASASPDGSVWSVGEAGSGTWYESYHLDTGEHTLVFNSSTWEFDLFWNATGETITGIINELDPNLGTDADYVISDIVRDPSAGNLVTSFTLTYIGTPDTSNTDTDGDGLTDDYEAGLGTDPNNWDSDGDGLSDQEEDQNYGTDPLSSDTDGDGLSDGDEINAHGTDPASTDSDGDGSSDSDEVSQGSDPTDPNITPVVDSDGDGTPDDQDAFPNDATETTDSDGDGTGDNADAFPNDASETTDSDGDGTGDNADAFPNDASETTDSDGDGTGDNADAFPNDASETTDSDGDGTGDNADAFPNDASETTDSDGDGTGDNADGAPNDPSSTTAVTFDESSISSPDFAPLTGPRTGHSPSWDYEIVGQSGATLTWDAVPGATEYRVTLNRYNYSDYPGGGGNMIDSVVYDKDNGYDFYGHNNNSTYSFTLPTETQSMGYIIRIKAIGSSYNEIRLDVAFVLSSDTPSQYQSLESNLRGSQTHPTIVSLERVTTEGAFGGTVPGIKVELIDTRSYPVTAQYGGSQPISAPRFNLSGSSNGGSFYGTGLSTREGISSALGTKLQDWTKQGSFYSFTMELNTFALSGNTSFRVEGKDSSEALVGSIQTSDLPSIDIDDANAKYEIPVNPTITITRGSSKFSWAFSGSNLIMPGNTGSSITFLNQNSGYGHYYGDHTNIAIAHTTPVDFINNSAYDFYVWFANSSGTPTQYLHVPANGSATKTFSYVREYNGSEADGFQYSVDSDIANGHVGTEGFIYVG